MPGGPGMLMGGGGPPIPAGGLYGCGCPVVHGTHRATQSLLNDAPSCMVCYFRSLILPVVTAG